VKIENELKKLGEANENSMNIEFRKNLRSYIINEYKKEYKTSFFSNFFDFLRFQSALNLSVIFLSVISVGTVASYIAMPDDMRTSVANFVTSKSEYTFTSNVDGSNVYINGELIGTSPLKYSLKEGNYTVRVEKDGYDIFTESFEVESGKRREILASLEKLPENSPYAGWLKYRNQELNISFFYPSDWVIRENFPTEEGSSFTIDLENDTGSIQLVYSSNDALSFDTSSEINSFKRVLAKNLSRYLQFGKSGEFVYGGVELMSENSQQKVLALYNLNMNQSEALSSNQLLVMDKIVESILVGNNEVIVAEEKVEKPVDNHPVDLSIAMDPNESIQKVLKETKISLPNVYSNRVYDYSINYPEEWRIYDARANYPVTERGIVVKQDGIANYFAQLRLRSSSYGTLYINTAVSDGPLYDSETDICGSSRKELIVESRGVSMYKSLDEYNDYGYQLCKGGNGRMVSGTGVSYAFFWDIDEEDYSHTAVNQVMSIVHSLNFKKLTGYYSEKNIEDKDNYQISPLDITLNPYPYDVQVVSCGDDCVRGELYQGGSLIMTISNQPIVEVNDELIVLNNRDVGGYVFKDYSNSVCDQDDVCVHEFVFGVHSSNRLEMVYHIPINDEIVRIVSSIRND
jgi:hypothetical protein